MSKKVHILGAGLSGMIAAIDLAKHDYEVTVIEKAKGIGGIGAFHPSVHGTPINLENACKYTGIDIRSAFRPFDEFRSYFGKTGYRLDPAGLYAVERSGRDSSIDALLYKTAQRAGVNFEFSQNINVNRDLPPGSIIAAGMYPDVYHSLKIPVCWFYGAAPRFETKKPNELVSIFDDNIGDYYYHGVVNGILFGHLFQREGMTEEIEKKCRDFLMEKEGFPDCRWIPTALVMPGWSFRGPRLFLGDKIMAGTISGMIDPVMGFGIVGAIYSGKIASMAVYSPEQAVKDFRTYTKNWHSNYISRRIMDMIPFKTGIMKFIMIKGSDKRKRKLMDAIKLSIPGVDAYPLMKIIN